MNLRQAAQRALKAMEDGEYRADMIEFSDALIALRAALAKPEQPYDQTALDLCKVCGWRTLIPGDACLNCERSKQPEQEPVGHADLGINNIYIFSALEPRVIPVGRTPLYTAPDPRKPLTYEELEPLCEAFDSYDTTQNELVEFARAIERAHGIGEQT